MQFINEEFKRRFNRKFRFVYLAVFIGFIIYMIHSDIRATRLVSSYHFNGVVDKVEYDGKSIPTVTVNGKDYYLGSTNWNFNHLISRGDSIEKDSGILMVKLIKQKSGRVLVFDGTKYYDK
jgi:hypothetical protein